MSFWILSLPLAALVALSLALASRRASTVSNDQNRDIGVYRQQLAEVDRDLQRGVISVADGERLRLEVSRRLLDADRAANDAGSQTPTRPGYVLGAVVAVAVFGGTIWIYNQLGAPDYPDQPLKARLETAQNLMDSRLSQVEVENQLGAPNISASADPAHLELLEKLRTALQSRPDDLQGFALLARNEAQLGNFVAARKAQGRVIEILADQANASDYADYADILILAANGYVSPQAETALTHALQRDPENGTALYYTGLMFAQNARADIAFDIWRDLLHDSPADAPWVAPIRAQIAIAAADAGIAYDLPDAPALRGPSAGDIAAANELSNAERDDMIRGMVTQLSDRLASQGGSPQEWARLIRTLGVLGEVDRARAVWAEAQQVFAASPGAIDEIRAAAQTAGITQ
ncbi:MAG: c-type cytochrome biogenesis protein CcmI [Marinosulfonomonas sp.]|nr:c-type cytochrome biogenesis protein CcmI [Marinosulfonomonas sp.]